MIYDLIIIGMGPGGISAAIYAKRAGLNIVCIDKGMVGGELNYIDKIKNYPGYSYISGTDLAMKMSNQLDYLDINVCNEEVIDIIDGDYKEVVTKNNNYKCKNIIIATGRVPKKLGLPNEDDLLGKGLSYCAICDGPLYKGLDVALVGGGNSALQEALYLSNIVNKIYVIHRRDEFRADRELVDKIKSQHNVELINSAQVIKLNKEDKLSSITLDNGRELSVSGLFVYIGFVPHLKFNLDIYDEDGYINVNNDYETNIKGIYAVGDCIKKDLYQVVTAISEGAIASTKISNK